MLNFGKVIQVDEHLSFPFEWILRKIIHLYFHKLRRGFIRLEKTSWGQPDWKKVLSFFNILQDGNPIGPWRHVLLG